PWPSACSRSSARSRPWRAPPPAPTTRARRRRGPRSPPSWPCARSRRGGGRSASDERTSLMGRRTKARECAFQMLYQWEVTRAPMDELVESFWRLRSTADATRARADELLRGTLAARAEIDASIETASTNWRLERIAAVDRTVLRLGAYELLHEPETPSAGIIDEAGEPAQRFGGGGSHAFVDGVLDARRERARGAAPP